MFTDAWEQRKLGEVAEKVTEKNKNNRYYETLTNSAEHGIINQREFFDKDISNKKNLDGYYIVRPDDFVYNPRVSNFAPVGSIKRNLLGRTGVMSPLYYVFRFTEGDNSFFEKYFSSNYWHNFIKFNGDNGVRSDRFNIKDSIFGEMFLPFPETTEQTTIGNFFRTLDDTITLYQRKLDGLKSLKKGYLEQMFPRAGERVPRVRFAGFTELWQERKLGEIAEFSKGTGYSKQDLKASGNPIILYGRLYTKYETEISDVDTFVEEKANSVKSKGDEVIVPASGESAYDIARASVVKQSDVILGGDLNVIRVGCLLNSTFLALILSHGKEQKEMSKRAQGKSVVHLHNGDLKEANISYPSITEQTLIGILFLNLDEQITTLQTKMAKLKQLKTAYLQKMFM